MPIGPGALPGYPWRHGDVLGDLADARPVRRAHHRPLVVDARAELVIEDMLDLLKHGKENLTQVLMSLPDDISSYLDSPDFQSSCLERFDQLDADRSGNLTADELWPVVGRSAVTSDLHRHHDVAHLEARWAHMVRGIHIVRGLGSTQ